MVKTVSIEIFIMLAIGLLLGLIGPFGTFETTLGVRIAFWVVTCLMGYAIFRPFLSVSRWVSEALGLPQMVGGGLALVIAAVPLTYFIALFFNGFDLAGALQWDGLTGLYLQVWLIGFLINAVFVFTLGRQQVPAVVPDTPPEKHAAVSSPSIDPSPSRIAEGWGTVQALKGEDHYVRVFTSDGEQLVLMRLRDAIADMGDTEGLQVHRSWWVATSGVDKVIRAGRSTEVLLKNGATVPVARDMLPRLRELRWL